MKKCYFSLIETFLNIMALLSKRIWNNQQTFISILSAKQSSVVNITEDGFKRHLKRLEDFRLSFKIIFAPIFIGLASANLLPKHCPIKKTPPHFTETPTADISQDGEN